MKTLVVVALLAIFACILVSGQDGVPGTAAIQITEITNDTFDDFLENTDDAVLIEFYSPVCAECPQLSEALRNTYTLAKEMGVNASFARINKDEAATLAMRFNVRDVPFLLVRTKATKKQLGQWKSYSGVREPKDILRFLSFVDRSHFPTKLKTTADVEQFIAQQHALTPFDTSFAEKPVLIGFFQAGRANEVEVRRFRTCLEEIKVAETAVNRLIVESYGIHFVGSKKGPAATSVVVLNQTIPVPSMALFKRNGELFEYNPPKPEVAATQEEEVKVVEETKEEEEEKEVEEVETESNEEVFTDNRDADATDAAASAEKPKEKVKEAKIKKPKLSKEEKKQLRLEEWKRKQRATSWRVTDMLEWVNYAAQSVVPEVGHWNFNELLSRGKPFFMAWVDLSKRTREQAGTARFWEDTVNSLINVAQGYTDKLTFGYAGGDRYPGIAKAFGVTNLVGFVIVDSVENKYLPEGTLTDPSDEEAYIKHHIDSFLAGTLKPYMRSEAAPAPNQNEDNADVPVKTIVASTFNKLVLDNQKDVLVEYYIPGCGHCQRLAPIYEQLGRAVASDTGYMIAKMNMDENDLPSDGRVAITGYPSVYLYKANDKTHPIAYEGERTVEAFLSFLKQQRSTPSQQLKEEL